MQSLRFTGVVLAGCLLFCLGCGGSAADKENAQHLRNLGVMYHGYANDHGMKGPAKADDLKDFKSKTSEKSFEALLNGDVIIIYDVSLSAVEKTPAKMEGTVLGYYKETPAKGGPV